MWANIYAVFLVVVSFITFCVYAADKKKAKKGAWRVPEKTLLCLSFFGGDDRTVHGPAEASLAITLDAL